ncbi:hypothetical protein Pla108_39160 [Botrimarina colliarenosi]|uniref:Glycosyl hydrolase-like 10 domain-containing protein n=1 Tax=Botrimarina colliarenosi TaxID=2528001 RepID=A0A5C6A0R5_9BACT|nr:family 10 glycosylhydrolase [Botrimarina colliarenosi]TWT93422.1 hypothetical protein Pla108_39160 [Botrimarina colliarenosi]
MPIHFLRRLAATHAAVFAACALPVIVEAAAPEVRGTWLTTTGAEDHIRTGANTAAVMADLRHIGLNTVYVETWKNGYTNYPSPTLAAMAGPDRASYLGNSRDLVQETVTEAHRNELNYIGWFEYGFAAEFVGTGGNTATPLGAKMRDNGWLLRDQSGRLGNSSNGFAWMNPAVPEVRQFLIDLTLETVVNYDLDGLQFDDRLAWPREFGWDATTAALYQQETGRSLPASVDDANFRSWRQDKVTLFAEELTAAVHAVRPDLLLSVSPSITNFSDVNYNAEWPVWQDAGLFDEYAVQVYRDNYASFNATLTGQVNQFSVAERQELVVGLRGNGSGANTPYADVEAMIERTRQVGAGGHALFYSKFVRDEFADELTAFYDVAEQGEALNPQFGPGHRAVPVVASAAGVNRWSVEIQEGSAYSLIAEIGGEWRELSVGYFPAGERELTVFGATRVELLADRRPVEPADFNGDGLVNAAEYTIWRDTFASITDLRADANGDNFVNLLDYDLWSGGYGYTAPTATTVPEPSSCFLLPMLFLGAAGITTKERRN